jgi:hypothetical protein
MEMEQFKDPDAMQDISAISAYNLETKSFPCCNK